MCVCVLCFNFNVLSPLTDSRLKDRVALLQADGRYDLELGRNGGDFSDLFRYDFFGGVDYLYPSYSDPLLGPFPNTDSYSQGAIVKTGHFISGISGKLIIYLNLQYYTDSPIQLFCSSLLATGEEMTFSILTSSPCEYNEVYFDLLLLTDGAGDEVSWSLIATSTNNIVLSGSDYSSYMQVNVAQCIPSDCYIFVINDSGGDGLCCELGLGGFSVRLNGQKLASGTEFGYPEEFDLQCLLTPTVSPTPKVSFALVISFSS